MSHEKYYRAFISSVGDLLYEERTLIQHELWGKNFFPIAMERFHSSSNNPSINVVIEYLKKCDFIIVVIGFLYGTIIPNFTKKDCPLTTCTHCKNSSNCQISYTQFEYLYALENKIPVYCIVHNEYNSLIAFKQRCEQLNMRIEDYRDRFETGSTYNTMFVKEMEEKFRYSYGDLKSLSSCINLICLNFSYLTETNNIRGLIEDSLYQKTSLTEYIEDFLFPMFKSNLFGNIPESASANRYIRCVAVKYDVQKRTTIYEHPKKENPTRKSRKRNEGVVGIMNKTKETIMYNFHTKKCYKYGRASAIELKKKTESRSI